MITGDLKNKIDALWNIFWTGGLTNPLDVIEQITYLMFIHDLDEMDNIKSKESVMLSVPYTSIFAGEIKIKREIKNDEEPIPATQLKWSVFRDFPAAKMYDIMQLGVFPFIKTLHADKNSAYSTYMDDAIFKVPTPQKLSQIVDALDDIFAMVKSDAKDDTRGDLYEYLLSKISTAGTNGQFRTPRHIIRMIVEMMAPKPGEVICDPACGTGGFLVSSVDYLKEKYLKEIFYDKLQLAHFNKEMFTGFDMDRTMLRIGAMNMMTHGVENPRIGYRDSLSDQNPDMNKYSPDHGTLQRYPEYRFPSSDSSYHQD